MSWSELLPSGPPADPFLVLAGLADAVIDYLFTAAACADCRRLGAPCLDHRAEAGLAADCQAAYAQLAFGGGVNR